jgi:hypothetical protein
LVSESSRDKHYDAAPLEPHLLYQGEIVTDLPLLHMPKISRWLLVRTGKGDPVMDALQNGQTPGIVKVLDSNKTAITWDNEQTGDYGLGYLLKTPVLVLNQTCDVQQKDWLQVAPVFPAKGDAAYLQRLERGEIFDSFPLSAHPPEIMVASFADLEQIQAVHKSYIKRVRNNQHFRLAPEKVRRLQSFLTRYFGRPNSFDVDHDSVPRTGTYLCISCFYMDGEISSIDALEDAHFPRCEKCGAGQWILRGR